MDKFSRDLSVEVKANGVTIQTLHPGLVISKMNNVIKKETLTVPSSDAYVAESLRTLGLESRTAGFWFHKIQVQSIVMIKIQFLAFSCGCSIRLYNYLLM